MNPQPIWHADPDSVVYFKALLRFDGPQRLGWLRCACSGPFQLFLDGEHIGSGPGGELTQVPAWDRFEIDAEAAGATSVLMVRAAASPEAGWFICEAQISGTTVISDPSWSTLAGTAAEPGTVFSEKYSAIADPLHSDPLPSDPLPSDPLHSEAESLPWNPCALAEAPAPAELPFTRTTVIDVLARQLVGSGEIEALPIPSSAGDLRPLTSGKCVHPDGLVEGHGQRTTVRTSRATTAVGVALDFGRVVCGTPFLSLQTAAAGGVVDLFFGRSADRFESAVRYMCGLGRQRWTGLNSHSCRFLLVRFSGFAEDDCVIEQLGIHVRRAETVSEDEAGRGGTIDGDEQLQALWAVGAHSTNAGREQVYRLDPYPAPYDWLSALPFFLSDCCQRGDTTTGLAMLASTRRTQGRVCDLRRWLGYPLFVEAYYQYSGDGDTVLASLSTVSWLLEQVQQQRQASGLLQRDGQWSAACTTMLAAGAVKAALRLFDSFSLKAERRSAGECSESLLASLESCWSQEAELFNEGEESPAYTQLTNALALYCGLVDEERQQQILAGLRGSGVEITQGLSEAFYLSAGLWEAKAYRRAMQCLQTYWGRILDREGPTWLDKQSRAVDAGAGAPGPDYFLVSRVVGVRPATPGYVSVQIEPPAIGIDHMAAELPTGGGRLRVEWWRPDSQRTCRVEVQTESDAAIRLCMPKLGIRFPEISVNDQTVWRNDKVVPNPWVHEIDDQSERIVLTVSATRSFAVQLS